MLPYSESACHNRPEGGLIADSSTPPLRHSPAPRTHPRDEPGREASTKAAEAAPVSPESPLLRLHALLQGPGSAEERLGRVQAELQAMLRASPPRPVSVNVSERQLATLELLAQGLSNRVIARRLQIGEATVKTHIKCLLERLNLPNRTSLALWAIRQGLVSPYGERQPCRPAPLSSRS